MRAILSILLCCFILTAKAQTTQKLFVYESVQGYSNHAGQAQDISQQRTIVLDLTNNKLLISPETIYGGITLVEINDNTAPSKTPYHMFNFKGVGKYMDAVSGSLVWIDNDEKSVLKLKVSETDFYYFIKKEIK